MNHYQHNPRIMWKSFFIMTILQTIPYPINLYYLPKPSWLSLILIYWVTKIPNHVSMGSGFVVGLIIDILSGPIIGIHAAILSSIIYFLIIKFSTFCNMPLWQQGLIVIIFSFNAHIIIYLTYMISINKIGFYPEIFLNNILLNAIMDGATWVGIFLIMYKINIKKKNMKLKIK